MKRLISSILALALLCTALFSSYGFADTRQQIGTASVVLRFSEDEDAAFRLYVKNVAKLYYDFYKSRGYYRPYYEAADEKEKYDASMEVWWNPKSWFTEAYYSVDPDAEDYDEYIKMPIQEMLLKLVEAKANQMMEQADMENYSVGMMYNPSTGKWEEDQSIVLVQEKCNAEIAGGLKKAFADFCVDYVKTIFDIGCAYAKAPGDAYDITEALANVADASWQKWIDLTNENKKNQLNNAYYEVMVEKFEGLQKAVDAQILSGLIVLNDVAENDELSESEEMLIEEIQRFIEKAQEPRPLSGNVEDAIRASAEVFVQECNVQMMNIYSPDEIKLTVVQTAAVTLAGEVIQYLMSKINLPMDAESQQNFENFVLPTLQMVVKEIMMAVEKVFVDNADVSTQEALEATVEIVLDTVKKMVVSQFSSDLTGITGKEIEALKAACDGLKKECDGLASAVMEKFASNLSEEGMEDDFKNLAEAREAMAKAQANLDETVSAKDKKAGMIGALIQDTVNLCQSLFDLGKSLGRAGDAFDDEAGWAYIALQMFETRMTAELFRKRLDSEEYAKFKDYDSIVDNPEDFSVDELADFVQCVLGVLNADITGHVYYTALAAGWEFQDSVTWNNYMDTVVENVQAQYDYYKNPVFATVVSTLGIGIITQVSAIEHFAKSEYLKTVANNEDLRYGWLSSGTCQDYLNNMIAMFHATQIPQRFAHYFK